MNDELTGSKQAITAMAELREDDGIDHHGGSTHLGVLKREERT